MLRARMSASESLRSQPHCESGSCGSLGPPCVHACVTLHVGRPTWGLLRGGVCPWVTAAHRLSPAPSCPPQPASLCSRRQMSPRCFSLPAWLRAVRVCVYFGQPTK